MRIRTVRPGAEGVFDFTDAHHLKRRGVTLQRAASHCLATAAGFRMNARTRHVEHARLVIAKKLQHLIRLFSADYLAIS